MSIDALEPVAGLTLIAMRPRKRFREIGRPPLNSLTGDVLVSFHGRGQGTSNMAKFEFSTAIVLAVFLAAAPEL